MVIAGAMRGDKLACNCALPVSDTYAYTSVTGC
jgi:hypothetical protein